MAMTETKRKYLLTIALLHKDPSHPFRPIGSGDTPGRIPSQCQPGCCWNSVKEEGCCRKKCTAISSAREDAACWGEALDHYGTYHAFCTNVLKLSAFDAQGMLHRPAVQCGHAHPAASQPTHERMDKLRQTRKQKMPPGLFFISEMCADRVVFSRFPGECSTDQLHDLRGGIFKRHFPLCAIRAETSSTLPSLMPRPTVMR